MRREPARSRKRASPKLHSSTISAHAPSAATRSRAHALGIVRARAAQRRDDLMARFRERAREPVAGERTGAGEKDPHCRPSQPFDAVELGIEVRPVAVLVRDLGRLDRPSMPNRGSFQRMPRSSFGRVEVAHQIERLGIVGERQDPVREAARRRTSSVRFSAVSSAPNQLPKVGRVRPQVDDGVPQRAADAAHHLHLGGRRELVVHAAQRALLGHSELLICTKSGIEPGCSEFRSGRRSARRSRGRRRASRARSCRRRAAASG